MLDFMLICPSGILRSSCAIATKSQSPTCCVIGIEPKNADDAPRSLCRKTLLSIHNLDTIANGA